MHVSLDGFTARPDGDLSWIVAEGEIFEDAIALTEQADTAMYGRVTYKGMESYWPTVPDNPSSSPDEIHHAQWVNDVHKVVVSKTLNTVEWNNCQIIKDNLTEEINKLKAQPGKNIMVFGSPGLSRSLMRLGLIDEYRLNVNPVILGSGIPLFQDIQDTINLKLLNAKTFNAGVVGLHYRRAS
jgi:dihydrofolate reductase